MELKLVSLLIRWLQWIGKWVWTSRIGVFIREVVGALLGIQQEDKIMERGEKVSGFAFRRILYFVLDYGLIGLSASLVVLVKKVDGTFLQAYFAMWGFDLIMSGAFFVYYLKTGNDLSLGEDFRRAVDAASNKSRVAGYIALAGVMWLAIVWTGPEKIVIFFRKEIKTNARTFATLLGLTSIQSVIWTPTYWFGYDLIVLVKNSL